MNLVNQLRPTNGLRGEIMSCMYVQQFSIFFIISQKLFKILKLFYTKVIWNYFYLSTSIVFKKIIIFKIHISWIIFSKNINT